MKLGRALFVSFLASLFIAHKNTIALKICLHFQEQIGTRNCISKHLAIANKLSCIDKTKKNLSVTATSLNITSFVFVWINSKQKEKKKILGRV